MSDGTSDRHHQRHAHASRARSPTSRPVAADLRRPGGDRHRERAAVQRDAQESAGAADRDRRYPESHRRSPSDVQPVFDAIANSAKRCSASFDAPSCVCEGTVTAPRRRSVRSPTQHCNRLPRPIRCWSTARTVGRAGRADARHDRRRRTAMPNTRWDMRRAARLAQRAWRTADARGRADRRDQRHAPRPAVCEKQIDLCRPSPTRP